VAGGRHRHVTDEHPVDIVRLHSAGHERTPIAISLATEADPCKWRNTSGSLGLMRINRTTRVAGFSARVIRDLLRALGETVWDDDTVAARLGIDRPAAGELIDRLLKAGYVRVDSDVPSMGRWCTRTAKGNRLALASAARPLTRATAERQLQAFMERVNTVNDNAYYLYRVSKVVLFGSMLTAKQRVGDVDVSVELLPKIGDAKAQQQADDARIRHALSVGRRFRNLVDEIFWPVHEVRMFLKSRSRAISIHDVSDLVLVRTASRVLYPPPDKHGSRDLSRKPTSQRAPGRAAAPKRPHESRWHRTAG